MGFKPSKPIYEIRFADYPGLEVLATGTTLGKLLAIGSIDVSIKNPNKIREVFAFFANRLITWNIEHPDIEDEVNEDGSCARCGVMPGAPLPTTDEAMYCLDLTFIMRIFLGWMEAVARLPVPKGMNIPNGETVQEEWMKTLGELQSPLVLQKQS